MNKLLVIGMFIVTLASCAVPTAKLNNSNGGNSSNSAMPAPGPGEVETDLTFEIWGTWQATFLGQTYELSIEKDPNDPTLGIINHTQGTKQDSQAYQGSKTAHRRELGVITLQRLIDEQMIATDKLPKDYEDIIGTTVSPDKVWVLYSDTFISKQLGPYSQGQMDIWVIKRVGNELHFLLHEVFKGWNGDGNFLTFRDTRFNERAHLKLRGQTATVVFYVGTNKKTN